jgi:hypothetical protein
LGFQHGDVIVFIRVGGHEAKGLAEGDVGNDIEGEVLGFAAEIEDEVFGDVFSVEEVDQVEDVAVDARLEVFDVSSGVLGMSVFALGRRGETHAGC